MPKGVMESKCRQDPQCTGFSFPVGATVGGGCLKKCGSAEFGGYGTESHDYWVPPAPVAPAKDAGRIPCH